MLGRCINCNGVVNVSKTTPTESMEGKSIRLFEYDCPECESPRTFRVIE